MAFIWKYIKEDALFLLIAPVFMLLSVAADLLQPTLMAQIVDNGVANGDLAYIKERALLMLLTTIGGLLAGIFSYYMAARTTARAGQRIRLSLFSKITTFSHKELDRFSVPTLITRMTNDVSHVQSVILSIQNTFLQVPFLLAGGLFMAIRLSRQLSLIFCIAIPVLISIIAIVLVRAVKVFPVVQKKLDALNRIARETILGMPIIKGYLAEPLEKIRFSKANDDLYNWQLKSALLMILMSPFIMMTFNFSSVAILWVGGYEVYAGQLEVGKIMAFSTYLSQILMAVMISSFVIYMFSQAQASLKRIQEVVDTETSIQSPASGKEAQGYQIDFDHVSFRYDEEAAEGTLRDIHLTIQENERIGIVGPTGSGKSSLVGLMLRFYDPQEGTVSFGGVPLPQLDLVQLRQAIGLVQQDNTVLSGSIEENLKIANPQAGAEDMQKALDQAMAQELYIHREGGLSTAIQQRGNDLSGGQQQRLSIARVLLQKPRVLILDDSTSALDVLTEKRFLDELDQHKTEQSQIIIAQRISTLKRCDRIIVMNRGRIEAIGSHENLLEESPTYQAIALNQSDREVTL